MVWIATVIAHIEKLRLPENRKVAKEVGNGGIRSVIQVCLNRNLFYFPVF